MKKKRQKGRKTLFDKQKYERSSQQASANDQYTDKCRLQSEQQPEEEHQYGNSANADWQGFFKPAAKNSREKEAGADRDQED